MFLKRIKVSLRTLQQKRSLSEGTGAGWKGRKRFYETATAVEKQIEGKTWYGVALNGKQLSTPNRLDLAVPTKALATALAHEWEMQTNIIRPATMPLMVITCSAIDVTQFKREDIISELKRYLTTDTLCFFQDEVEKVHLKQQSIWKPVIEEFSTHFGEVDVRTDMSCPKHPESTVNKVTEYLNSLDHFQLTAMESLTSGLKSIITSLTLLKSIQATQVNRSITSNEAIQIARLEEEHQIEEWGLVEGGHDIDRANIEVQTISAATFLKLLSVKN